MAGSLRYVATIVDHFYSKFAEVEEAALNALYQADGGEAFAYRTASVPADITKEALFNLHELVPWNLSEEKLLSSRFLLGTQDDWEGSLRHGSRIHYDRVSFAAVIYISQDRGDRTSGTSLYAHKSSGARYLSDCTDGSLSLAEIMAESGDVSEWREHLSVGLIPNRMLLFDPKHFHQAHEYFGHEKSNARIIHNMFFGLPSNEQLIDPTVKNVQ